MKRLFITFIITALIIGIMSIGCDKETVTGPIGTVYDTKYDTIILDTVTDTVTDTITVG